MTADLSLDLPPHDLPGRLIVFEGTDGSGKTTLTRTAVEAAGRLGRRAVEISLLANHVKDSAEFRDYSGNPEASLERVDLLALSLVCAGSRLQQVRMDVLGELIRGSWVFCDRYVFTTWAEFLALSTSGRDREALRPVLEVFPAPDLRVLAHASPELCFRRVAARPEEAFKTIGLERYAALGATYRRMAAANDFEEISSEQPFEACAAIVEELLEYLHARTGAYRRSAL
jgi:dTMP kinase